jgi:hypothetical protein
MIETFETIAEGGVIRLPENAPPSAHCVVTILDDDLGDASRAIPVGIAGAQAAADERVALQESRRSAQQQRDD